MQRCRVANWSTAFLVLNGARSMNSEWPVQMGFDASGSMSDTKFDLVGITTNSLRSRANPVCLAMANKESADAYEHMYETMESGLFQLVARTIRCDPESDPPCEACVAIEEQVQQPVMREELDPPKRKKGLHRRRGFRFLWRTLCVTTRQNFPISFTRKSRT